MLRTSLTHDFPNTPWHFLKLAEACRGLAKIQNHRRDFAEARRLQEHAVEAARAALALAPENAEYRRCVASECATLVETLIALKKHDEATRCAADFARHCHDSAPETLRAGSFMAQCVPLAAADAQLPDSRRAELTEAYAKQAISLVRAAVAKGYRDGDAVRSDRTFDSVRAHSEFASLLAQMVKSPRDSTR